MKKLIIVTLAFVSIQLSAQERKAMKADVSAEEFAQLQTKKMVLALDLTEEQQKEISKIHLENAKVRKAEMETRKLRKNAEEKPTKEEILKMKNNRLDAQIATKQKLKSILSAEQYEKWEKLQSEKRNKAGKRKMISKKKRMHKGEDKSSLKKHQK
ncbi:hypothetical protein DFR65_10114 [Oceanihabitans sediminis]|uniref:DUF4890 domain-containing protein n=1 Tax=Oceanihabitans sediminis TaxID=1812012 RepID=A0A368P5U6_9FLAO|nr:hypothetical protein [Oceanihabitans sediminis]RBP34132.1 hypothetical protein DFR65_10114 [Oceanihabitans sediminis]RCU57826.1 hypothetical protein DU428_00065 [Oceanihabitans sediminis]